MHEKVLRTNEARLASGDPILAPIELVETWSSSARTLLSASDLDPSIVVEIGLTTSTLTILLSLLCTLIVSNFGFWFDRVVPRPTGEFSTISQLAGIKS